jgi:hypothetical protein
MKADHEPLHPRTLAAGLLKNEIVLTIFVMAIIH